MYNYEDNLEDIMERILPLPGPGEINYVIESGLMCYRHRRSIYGGDEDEFTMFMPVNCVEVDDKKIDLYSPYGPIYAIHTDTNRIYAGGAQWYKPGSIVTLDNMDNIPHLNVKYDCGVLNLSCSEWAVKWYVIADYWDGDWLNIETDLITLYMNARTCEGYTSTDFWFTFDISALIPFMPVLEEEAEECT